MVDKECGIVRGEVCKQGHYHGFIGIHSHVAHAPAGAVAGPEGDLVAFLEAELFEYEVEFFNLCGHLAVGEGIAAYGVEGGLVPELAGCVLQSFQVMGEIRHMRIK